MRIKLCLEKPQLFGRKQKVCFLVKDGDCCKTVSDLAYKIQKRFYKSNDGRVSLFLEDFFLPPAESVDIIKENDILTVRVISSKETTSSSDSSDSSSDEDRVENHPPKKIKKAVNIPNNNDKKSTTDNQKPRSKKQPTKSIVKKTFKKTVPLSQLGVINKKSESKKDNSSSSIESSSSDDSSGSSESEIDTKTVNTKEKQTMKKPISSKSTVNKIPETKKIKKAATDKSASKITISDSSSGEDSSCSSSSSSSSSDDEPIKKKSKKVDTKPVQKPSDNNNNNDDNSTTKIDFHMSSLSSNATSTPSVLKKSANKSGKISPSAKAMATKDKYKNVSQVFTYSPGNPTESQKSFSNLTKDTTWDSSAISQDSNTSPCKVNNASAPNTSKSPGGATWKTSLDEKPAVRGKTLRNRRRRHRQLELRKQADENKQESNMDTEDVGVETNGVNDKNANDVDKGSDDQINTEKPKTKPTFAQRRNLLGSVAAMLKNVNGNKQDDQQNIQDNEQPNWKSAQKTNVSAPTEEVKMIPVTTQGNYEEFDLVKDCPPKGSTVAFKLLTINNGQPLVSEYKEAKIISFDKLNNLVELAPCPGQIIEENILGRFGMFDDDDDDDEEEDQQNDDKENLPAQNITKDWNSLIQTRLVSKATR